MIKLHAQNCRHLLIKSQCFPYASCLESRWLWPALSVKWVGDTKDEENHRVLTSGEIQHPKCPQEWQNRWVFSFKRLYEVGFSMNFHEFPLWQPVKRTCLSTPLDIVGWVSWSVPPFRGDSGWHPGWLQVTWQVPTSRVLKIAKRQSLNLIEKYLISL